MKLHTKPLFIAAALAVASTSAALAQTANTVPANDPNAVMQVTPSTTIDAPTSRDATPMSREAATTSDDARERAARRAGATAEEEHGGVRGWARNKLDRTSARMRGLDSRTGTMVGNASVDDSGGLAANGHVTGR